jgi:YVTN family beta-propeller protein
MGLLVAVLGSVPVTAEPLACVANNGAGTVSVIDTARNTVIATVAVGNRPLCVATTPDGAFAYVTL